ncbi:MAG: hypothetical protein HPY50_16435 [Firmicutes bacterium]|nr:hypothetical protein [Bacillota bacterium]
MTREEALRIIHKRYITPREATSQYLRWKSECERKAKDLKSPWNNELCTLEERQWFKEYDLRKLEAFWILSDQFKPGQPAPMIQDETLEDAEPDCPIAPLLRKLYQDEIRLLEIGTSMTICRVICPKVLGIRMENRDGSCRLKLRLIGEEKIPF